ncbi:hypothetical protein BB559_002651 [Furculomyces boomerangus]|uniref:Major facilitator superfamily (MFS) profile domain-containing protein n=1 Tax=Furculomyces boomerangus TaxID=61424 RepID=A0A2T9YTL6_9FUNG|nr:hypothetical protein BB559_002651 [Furculomyces boomerangus]
MGKTKNTPESVYISEKELINQSTELTEDEKRIVKSYLRKVDLRILPIIISIYVFSLIDRGNIGAALVFGLRAALGFTKSQEANATSVFYIVYILLETPSNMILKKFRPHYWGLLGAFESGYAPGVIGYYNYWYTRSEIGLRITLLFFAAPISGIIGGPLASKLASANFGRFKPFQAIFLVEGSITLLLSITAFFVLIDYPDEAKFFTPEEQTLILCRLKNEQGIASQTKVSFRQTFEILQDWKIWTLAIITLGLNNLPIVTGVFGPTIIKAMGYTGGQATNISAIPSACGFVGLSLILYLINKIEYWLLIFMFGSLTGVSYAIVAFATGNILRLVFLSVAGFGGVAVIPVILTWISANQGGVYKALIASGITISAGSVCGIVTPRFFVAEYAPKFTNGHVFTLAVLGLAIGLSVFLGIYFKMENKRRENNFVDVSHLSEKEQRNMYDKHPEFRYKP